MTKFILNSKDRKHSQFQIKVYFFKDEKQVDTKTACMYSKFSNQKEAKNAFDYWRNRIHFYRQPGNSEFGMKVGEIYNNLNPDRKKKPILRIYANGVEKWYLQAVHLSLQ